MCSWSWRITSPRAGSETLIALIFPLEYVRDAFSGNWGSATRDRPLHGSRSAEAFSQGQRKDNECGHPRRALG